MKWLLIGALFAVAVGKADGPQFVNSVTNLVGVAAPYVHQLGTAVQGSVRELERAAGTQPVAPAAAARGNVQAAVVVQSAANAQGAPGAAAGVYTPSSSRALLADGVVTLDVTVDQVFGVSTYLSRGTGFYVSPGVAITAQHVTVGHLGPRAHVGNSVALDITSEAPGLDITLLTPYHGWLTATVPAATPLPTVYHPLENRRPAVGEQLTALCRYNRDLPISPVQMVVTNPDTMVVEYLPMPSVPRVVPGIALQVLSGDEHEGCSGAPIVDATGGTVAVVLTGNATGGVGAASTVDIIPWLRAMRVEN